MLVFQRLRQVPYSNFTRSIKRSWQVTGLLNGICSRHGPSMATSGTIDVTSTGSELEGDLTPPHSMGPCGEIKFFSFFKFPVGKQNCCTL